MNNPLDRDDAPRTADAQHNNINRADRACKHQSGNTYDFAKARPFVARARLAAKARPFPPRFQRNAHMPETSINSRIAPHIASTALQLTHSCVHRGHICCSKSRPNSRSKNRAHTAGTLDVQKETNGAPSCDDKFVRTPRAHSLFQIAPNPAFEKPRAHRKHTRCPPNNLNETPSCADKFVRTHCKHTRRTKKCPNSRSRNRAHTAGTLDF